jgi:citrate lyase subunit beta/citryl-CoA lyase
MRFPRSYLFVPGHRPDRFAKAAASGADRIILDLEDAVGPSEKAVARQSVVDWLKGGGEGIVRINGADTPWFSDDLNSLVGSPPAAIMVPKVDRAALERAHARVPKVPLIALIETVAGLAGVNDLAACPGLVRLAFGNLDFSVDAGIPGSDGVLDPARFQIVLASRLAGLAPPIDGVTAAFKDDQALFADIAGAHRLGFGAKLCIHPLQVDAVNRGFAPTAEEIAWAERIIAAVQGSSGEAVQVDGKMVDSPVVAKARRILDLG